MQKKTKKRTGKLFKPGKRGDMPGTIAKRYKLPEAVVVAIKKQAPSYGSQGRALQVATELLIRRKKPIHLGSPTDEARLVGMTYKLTPRTAEIIESLVDTYGTRGKVIAACAEILVSSGD